MLNGKRTKALTSAKFSWGATVAVFLLITLGGVQLSGAGNIYYVDASAISDVNNGTSWADAYTDLQSAITVAVSGDTIRVAEGTYRPTSGEDRTLTFHLTCGVTLEGGYPAGGSDVRDPDEHETILSGDIGNPNDATDNSYHVVTAGCSTADVMVLDGFTVTAGNANRPSDDPNDPNNWSEDRRGAGLFIANGSLTVTNVVFSSNSADDSGGGMLAYGTSPTLTNVTFSGNSARYLGGGVQQLYGTLTLVNVNLTGNSAIAGGGVGVKFGTARVASSTFSNNAASSGAGFFADGGDHAFTNVTFTGNMAENSGGGIHLDNRTCATLTHVTIAGNTASSGAGLNLGGEDSGSSACNFVRNSIIWGNTGPQLSLGRSRQVEILDSVVQDGCPTGNDPFMCTNVYTADPKLGQLSDNGGYTQTIPLLAGSSAIDKGADYGVNTDQRGVTRPLGAGYDLGAFEYEDVTPPVVTVPGDKTAEASGPAGAVVTFTASALDDVDGNVPVTCTPASGSVFPLGMTSVTCTAQDAAGNLGGADFTVTVVDTTPPALTRPDDIVAEATSAVGAIVNYMAASASDAVGVASLTYSQASGTIFPIGTTTVLVTAKDAAGNATSDNFTVTVRDTTPPTLIVPPDVTVTQMGDGGTPVVLGQASATDICDPNPTVTNNAPALFPVGTTTVTWTATDASGNQATGTQKVTVVAAQPPSVEVTATPNTIWPPNKKMVPVILTVTIASGPAPVARIVGVTCNETIAASDVQITGPLTVSLRANRDGNGSGRVYTINLLLTFASGSTTSATVTVRVPHDQGK